MYKPAAKLDLHPAGNLRHTLLAAAKRMGMLTNCYNFLTIISFSCESMVDLLTGVIQARAQVCRASMRSIRTRFSGSRPLSDTSMICETTLFTRTAKRRKGSQTPYK
jgi:hypothetical protein